MQKQLISKVGITGNFTGQNSFAVFWTGVTYVTISSPQAAAASAELQSAWRSRTAQTQMCSTSDTLKRPSRQCRAFHHSTGRVLKNLSVHFKVFHSFSWPCCVLKSAGVLNILWNHGRKCQVALLPPCPPPTLATLLGRKPGKMCI